jgi:hypothetical protein
MRPVSIASLRQRFYDAASEFSGDDNYDTKRLLASRRHRDEATRIIKRFPRRWPSDCDAARERFVEGRAINLAAISPRIVLCSNMEDYAIHRYYSAASGFPTRDRPGRRMKLLLVDDGQLNRPVMAVATLSSAVSVLPTRDRWIGWGTDDDNGARWERLAYVLDLSTCIGIPPYAGLTTAKLMAHLALSRECQEFYRQRYENQPTERLGRIISQYALVVGTGAFKSRTPAYKGFKLRCGEDRFVRLGMTGGYSSAHIPDDLYAQLLSRFGADHRYGVRRRGPHVRFHNLRVFARLLDIDEELVIRPGQRRSVYVAPTATNARPFLQGRTDRLAVRRPWAQTLIKTWRERWLAERLAKPHIVAELREWRPCEDMNPLISLGEGVGRNDWHSCGL